jgi:DNA-binding transcriptional MocR family regulator
VFIKGIQLDVAFAMGSMFYTSGGGSHAMRLNYGIHTPADIREGFRRIGVAWHDLNANYDHAQKSTVL